MLLSSVLDGGDDPPSEGDSQGRSSGVLLATLRPTGRVTHCDEAWSRVFGSGRDPWTHLSPEDRRTAVLRVAEAAAGTATNQLFLVPIPDAEEPAPVLLQFFPVHRPGGGRRDLSSSVCAITVTAEVLSLDEDAIDAHLQRDRMEALGRWTMGITHDFNNLLSSILGHTELVRATYRSSVPALALSDYLRTIEQAALDGAGLIQKIQRYIRREADVQHEPLDLVGLLDFCLLLTRPYWYNEPRRKGISIDARMTSPSGGAPPVMGTAYELREMFVNLILNAVGAMSEGGRLLVDVTCEEDTGVRVCVSDTGVGMPPAVLARIFEPLYTTKGDRGSGMGLAVTESIIRKHGGSITVESEPGKGTTFTITLPVAEVQGDGDGALGAAPEVDAGSVDRPLRIIVVDDEPAVRTVLAKLLATRGYTVEVADSAAAALAVLEEAGGGYDILFTDRCMPEMDGRQLAESVRRRYPRIPIVLVSGDTLPGEPDEAVDVVIGKPFRLGDLDAVVKQLVPAPPDEAEQAKQARMAVKSSPRRGSA